MKDAELNRILTATQAHLAPRSSLSLHARLISHLSLIKSQKGQTPLSYWY